MPDDPRLADRIDAVLPQTQCRQCGYQGCRPYAEAVAAGRAEINRCPPGGEAGVARLARVTGREPIALDPACGIPKTFRIALIDEAICIGCTLCIAACPVDAIVGAARRMHDVVAELCTGCELCLPPCPVDCIAMVDAPFEWDDARADAARQRHQARATRLARLGAEGRAKDSVPVRADPASIRKQRILEAAIARARARRPGA